MFFNISKALFFFKGDPYPSVPVKKLFMHLRSGNRLKKPAGCCDELEAIMQKCWCYKPEQRPTFLESVTDLERILSTTASTEYINLGKLFQQGTPCASLESICQKTSQALHFPKSSGLERNTEYTNNPE